MELSKSYSPESVEKKWYPVWMQAESFSPDSNSLNLNYRNEHFSIVIPPPNVTGVLHMGHALNSTLQDVLTRYHRMQGFQTLWIPGMDHAGIATQSVVEKKLLKEKIDKYELGRDNFVSKVWEWKQEHGGIIQKQLREMGHSPDWNMERFTLDEGLNRAVRRVFVSLYNEGLIYRGKRIINWCPMLRTALSDEEVDHKEIKGNLYHIRYPLEDGTGYLTVATTRPETMLGDSAVAFHPDDERYRHLAGKRVVLPLMDRAIPLVPDAFVDPSFGTGLVKVTPAHDPNDFEIGQRHNLEQINVLTEKGYINEAGGRYAGLYRFEARKKIVEDLEAMGLLEKTQEHSHAVGHCYRTGDVVEPYLTEQWFVKMKALAEPAMQAVADGRIRFIPRNWEKTYMHWMENIKDWCISRQLWWGHRIPAWYCSDCQGITVQEEQPAICVHCGSRNLVQDEDVLDTWFSSALWPFSTMGWPEEDQILHKFYPTSVLVTAFDIIFFWVARMIMMGLKFMDDVPFRDVLIHGLVLDEYGQKQSKSKGNVINPLEMMYKYGTDAFRLTMVVSSGQGRGIRWNENTVSGYRHFANKIWNAARFIFMNVASAGFEGKEFLLIPNANELHDFDIWILGRTRKTLEEVNRTIHGYRLGEAASLLYDFVWKEYCDWYIELSKDHLRVDQSPERRKTTLHVLIYTLVQILKMLHPFMPFITEELYSSIVDHNPEMMLQKEKLLETTEWPDFKQIETLLHDKESITQQVQDFMDMVFRIRQVRGEMSVQPNVQISVVVVPESGQKQRYERLVGKYISHFKTQAKLTDIEVREDYKADRGDAKTAVMGALLCLPLAGIIDFDKERERLQKELSKIDKVLPRVEEKLQNPEFMQNAPEEIIEKEREKASELRDLRDRFLASLQLIQN